MHTQTISELRQQLDRGEVSATEVASYFQQRIETLEPKLNSFITTTFDNAQAEAKAADEAIAKKETGLLTGVPIAHKDLISTKGVLTTAASKMLSNYAPPFDATIVENLRAQGAVSFGKVNMDEFAMGSTGKTSFYGVTNNPWNTDHVAGGSSSGSAAAVAAGLVLAATGSDTGGSIRQPASFCGVTGIKPTYGRVSRFGMIAFASSLDQGGVLAKSAEDCAIVLEGMSGYDPKDPTSANRELPAFSKMLDLSLKGIKIALPKAFFDCGLDAATAKAIDETLAIYRQLGAEFVEVDLKYHDLVTPVYYVVAPAEAASNLSRFDGIRYGYRAENVQNLEELYDRTRTEGFGQEVKSRILMGTYAKTEVLYQDFFIKGQKVRRLIANEYQEILKEVDFIAGPTVAGGAFSKDHKASSIQNSLFDANLIGANLAGLPALSHPMGMSNNMPVGFQLIGRAFDEARLLAAAHQYQLNSDWHKKRPADFA